MESRVLTSNQHMQNILIVSVNIRQIFQIFVQFQTQRAYILVFVYQGLRKELCQWANSAIGTYNTSLCV